MTRSFVLSIALGVIVAGVVPQTHHAVGDLFDENQILTLRGEIVALVYRNPHSRLHLTVTGQRGGEQTWAVEWRGAHRPAGGGLDPTTLNPGDHVVVCGNPGRNPGQFRLLLRILTTLNDRVLADAPRCPSRSGRASGGVLVGHGD